MFYPKLRHAPSNSIIDISSIQYSKNVLSNHSHPTRFLHTPLSKSSHNQNRARSQPRTSSYFSHHQLCHSQSNDSLDKELIQTTKQTVDKLFLQTNFDEVLDQIQYTLQPIVEQLRYKTERKKYLSKQDRFICMKSCAKFITETLLKEQWNLDENFTELYRLRHVLDRFLSNQRTNMSVQLETDMRQLHISHIVEKNPTETTNLQLPFTQNLEKASKVPFVPVNDHQTAPVQSTDDLTCQKNYHRSVSRAFRQLNTDLQKMNHETPFKAHLSKYHKHNH